MLLADSRAMKTRTMLTTGYAIAATVTAIVWFSVGGSFLGQLFGPDPAPSISAPRGPVLPTPDPVPSRAPRDAASLTWCRDDEDEANDHVPPGLRVSAAWALETAVQSGLAQRLTTNDAGITADPTVICPDFEYCDQLCFYRVEFLQLGEKIGDVAVNARTGDLGAYVAGTWTTMPSPRPLP